MARRETGKVRFAIHHPPLAFLFPLQRGEAERRQTQIQPPRFRRGARSAERARLSAFHRGSHLREYLIPKARLQARLPGTWSERALPAFACPSPGMHLPPRSSCREADTQAAREQPAKPPAGTALAPMTRCASAPRPSRSEDCDVTGRETDVKGVVTVFMTCPGP